MNETAPKPTPRLSWLTSGLIPILIVVTAAVVPRLPCVLGDVDFVWDDSVLLVDDARTADASSIPGYFTGPYLSDWPEVGQYRPLVNVTLTIERVLFGDGQVGLHRAVNLLLHVMASVLLLLLGRRLVPDRPVVPILAAVLFAEHPIAAETVGWIVARGDSGAAVFSLLAILLYLTRKPVALIGAAVSLLVAMFFKPVAVVVPGILVLIEMNRLGRGPRDLFRVRRIAPLVLLLIPIIVAFISRRGAIGTFVPQAEGVVLRGTDVVHRFILAGGLLVRHLMALVLPVGLTGDYQADPAWREGGWTPPAAYLVATLLVLAVTGWMIFRRRRGSLEVFGLVWAVLFLLPVLQFVPIGALMADRFLYLPAMGIALAAASLLDRLAGGVAGWSARGKVVGIGIGLILSCFFALDLARGATYANDEAFNRDVLSRYPDGPDEPWRKRGLATVHVRLGDFYARQKGATDEETLSFLNRARMEFHRASELDPGAALPLYHLGQLYYAVQKYGDAELQFARALGARAGPTRRSRILYDLARTLLKKEEARGTRAAVGDPIVMADAYLSRALALRPRFAKAMVLRGWLNIRYLGHPEEGRHLLHQALEAAPHDPALAALVRKRLAWAPSDPHMHEHR
jgi:tetratricopeptide (TPR) repeat protein